MASRARCRNPAVRPEITETSGSPWARASRSSVPCAAGSMPGSPKRGQPGQGGRCGHDGDATVWSDFGNSAWRICLLTARQPSRQVRDLRPSQEKDVRTHVEIINLFVRSAGDNNCTAPPVVRTHRTGSPGSVVPRLCLAVATGSCRYTRSLGPRLRVGGRAADVRSLPVGPSIFKIGRVGRRRIFCELGGCLAWAARPA
jgi:hypothetical protein